jgi:adhesin HecA-like repeat protein
MPNSAASKEWDMKAWNGWWLWAGLGLALAGCTEGEKKKDDPGPTDSGPPHASVTLGPGGGSVQLSGARLDVPAGALTAATVVTLDVEADPAPAASGPLGPVFRLGPATLTFASAAQLTLGVPSNTSQAALWWAPGADGAFAAQGGGRVQNAQVRASVTQAGRAFAGMAPVVDGGPADSGVDAGPIACSAPHPTESCARGVASNGEPTCECPDRCGGKVYRLKCDGTTCQCLVDSEPMQSFSQGNTCTMGVTAAIRFCQGLGALPDAGHADAAVRDAAQGADASLSGDASSIDASSADASQNDASSADASPADASDGG